MSQKLKTITNQKKKKGKSKVKIMPGSGTHLQLQTLGRQRLVDLLELKANLVYRVYRVSSRMDRASQTNPVSKNKQKKGKGQRNLNS